RWADPGAEQPSRERTVPRDDRAIRVRQADPVRRLHAARAFRERVPRGAGSGDRAGAERLGDAAGGTANRAAEHRPRDEAIRRGGDAMTSNGTRSWSGYLFLAPYLLLFTSFLVVPLIFGLGLSFARYEMLSREPATFIGLKNYAEAMTDPKFGKALL